jgi:F0F1-type ATP synthase alpha subunit
MTELLRQPQYAPVPVEEQVAVLYAGSSGALDEVPLPRVAEFERSYLAHLRANHAALLQTLRQDKKWSDALAKQFDEISAAFKAEFLAGGSEGAPAAAAKAAPSAKGAAAPKRAKADH